MPEPPPPMSTRPARAALVRQRIRQERVALGFLLLLALAVFCGGITWGLPSSEVNHFLFGTHAPWSGSKILELTGSRESTATQGADVDRNPLGDRHNKVVLNRTDRQRAEIVRRYRLYSYQPDEMVTFLALAGMKPSRGDFDPKLYQYGGLWIYPVGALLKVCNTLGIVRVTPDLAWYLDHPADFGRFYVIARLYVVAWAMLGAWAVLVLTRRLSGSLVAGSIACFCYIMMPVVVNMSHEAKPHLPGAVLILLAALATIKYVRTAERYWWLIGSVLTGAAVSMVLTAWPALVLPFVAALLMRQEWQAKLRSGLGGLGIAVAVYFITNPYVFVHLFNNRELLMSNLGNTRAMFTLGLNWPAIENAAWLVGQGTSPAIAVGGAIAAIALIIRAVLRKTRARRHSAWMLFAPSALGLGQFALFASGQPAEYGRFAVLVDVALMIGATTGFWRVLERLEWRPELLVVLGLAAAVPGSRYYPAFVSDATGPSSRMLAAEVVEELRLVGGRSVGVFAEPAPYAVPPLNLFGWRVVLLPRDYNPATDRDPPDVIVRAVDRIRPLPPEWAGRYEMQTVQTVGPGAPMRWAAKPFEIMQLIER